MKKILAICLAVVALLASCRPDEPDVDPVVLKGGVDMGLVLTREDGLLIRNARIMLGTFSPRKTATWENTAVPVTSGIPCVRLWRSNR